MSEVKLTEREQQVLAGMAKGHNNGEIGRELYLSEDSVKTHALKLYRKVGARGRVDAVVRGLQLGLITVPGLVTVADIAPTTPAARPAEAPQAAVRLTATARDAHVLVRAWLGGKLPASADRLAQLEQHALGALHRLVGTATT